MKNLNLFPYRQQRQWQMTRAFQRAVLITTLLSLALSLGLAWVMSSELNWPGQLSETPASVKKQQAEQQELVEKMYAHIESTHAWQQERQRLLLVLSLIRNLAEEPSLGVWIQHVHWVDGALQIDAWVHSDEHAQAWVQRLQATPGVVGVEKIEGSSAALALEMAMTPLPLRLKIGDTVGQP